VTDFPVEPALDKPAFAALGLDSRLLETLTKLGYEEPTPIQREAIPPLLAGRNLFGQAATGTGKTAAFALPMLHKLAASPSKSKAPRGLVLVPTRELAMQVAEATHRYGERLGIRVLPVYGGAPFEQQVRGLFRGVDVVVATPGRALDHFRQKTLDLRQIEVVVLDEGDEMLDMGFLDDIETLIKATPETRQMVMFSATLPPRVASIAKRHLPDPIRIQIVAKPLAGGDVPQVKQLVYVVPRNQKATALGRLMDVESPGSAIVFCRTRIEVDELVVKLGAQGYRVEALHGGMSQAQRDRVMKKLRGASADLVVATDVAARGLDIDRLTHVFNYDVPLAPESYVHRIGRVGRAGREGVAITLAEPRERRLIRNIETITRQRMELAHVPTLADMQARRLEATRALLRETLLGSDFDAYRAVIEPLLEEFELIDVAAAALKIAHQAQAGGAAEEAEPPQQNVDRSSEPMERLMVNAGRIAGIRPQDLVGAIAGETGVPSRDIGAIQIADRFSLVEVRQSLVDLVIKALSETTVKGMRVLVKRDDSPNRGRYPEPRKRGPVPHHRDRPDRQERPHGGDRPYRAKPKPHPRDSREGPQERRH
jgi:ATP-dependent RNA helicase DeaD